MNENNSMNVRFDSESRQSLEKANFDMKMKIYYLEEEMRKLRRNDGNSHSSEDIDDFKSEIESLKLRMQEKGLELEQRNNLLSKAKRAIEALKLRIEQLQNEDTLNKNIQRELEKQVETINHSSAQLESGYKVQIKEYEEQLQLIRHQFSLKENDYAALDEKYTRLESTSAHNDRRIMELCNHNNSLLLQLENLESKHGTVMEELTQSLAHEDIYKLQVEEVSSNNRILNSNIAELKQKLHEMEITHEGNLKAAHMQSQLDMEKLKQTHIEAVASIKEANYREQSKMKAEYEETFLITKDFEINGLNRTLSELEKRLSDKADEVQSLRSIIEQENTRYSNAMDEMERTRASLTDTQGSNEANRLELQIQKEENRNMQNTISELQNVNHTFKGRVEDLQHENSTYATEIQSLKSQLIEATDTLESTHVMMKEYEMNLKAQEKDIQILTEAKSDSKTMSLEMSSTARENERLKITVAQLEGEIKEYKQIKLNLSKENESLSGKITDLKTEAEQRSVSMRDNDSVAYNLRQSRDQLEVQLQDECTKANRLEAVLAEQRELYATVEKNLQEERRLRVQLERDCSSGELKLHSFQQELGKGCHLAYNAMLQWEDVLAEVLEPSIFRGRNTGNNHSNSYMNPDSSSVRNNQNTFKSRNHILDGNSYMDISRIPQEEELDVDGRQVLQNIISQIACMNKSMERITRIRDRFISTVQNIESTITENAVEIANNKISVYSHKMEKLEKKMEQLNIVFNRDRKLHQHDVTEMKELKEHVFIECAEKIKDSEVKYLSLKSLYDNEVRAHNQCKNELDQCKLEVDVLHKQEERLMKTEEALRQMQVEHESIETKLEHYAENNQLLSYEVEDRGTKLESVCNELDKVIEEREAVMVVGERLRYQIATRDELIAKYEKDILLMSEEITVLKTKQMDPSLAASIKQTQRLLQSRGHATSTPRASSNGNDHGSIQEQLDESMSLVRSPSHSNSKANPLEPPSPVYSRPSYPPSPFETSVLAHSRIKQEHDVTQQGTEDDHSRLDTAQKPVEYSNFSSTAGAVSDESRPQHLHPDEDDDITARYNAIMARRKQQQGAQSVRRSDKIHSSDLYSSKDGRQAFAYQQASSTQGTPAADRERFSQQPTSVSSVNNNTSSLMKPMDNAYSFYTGPRNTSLQHNVNINNSLSSVGGTPSRSFISSMGISTPQTRLNSLGTSIDALAKKLDKYNK